MKKIFPLAAVVTVLAVASSAADAKGPGGAPSGGASSVSPGQQFRANGPVTSGPTAGPGASGYAPGRLYIGNGGPTTGSPGASVYAPGFLK
jgi:hypothetical protein